MARPKTSRKKIIVQRNNVIRELSTKGISQSDIASMLRLPRNTVHLVLMNNIENEYEIRLCKNWLSQQEITKTITHKYDSYHVKHIIERWCGTYISNDSLMKAVKEMKIDHELIGESGRYAYLPISSKTIHQAIFSPRDEEEEYYRFP